MKYPGFVYGFCTTIGIFIVINAADYFWQRSDYYAFLERSEMVWAGAWTWGVPFPMMVEGLGGPGEMYSLVSPFAVVNVVLFLAVAGLVGAGCETVRSRVRQEEL